MHSSRFAARQIACLKKKWQPEFQHPKNQIEAHRPRRSLLASNVNRRLLGARWVFRSCTLGVIWSAVSSHRFHLPRPDAAPAPIDTMSSCRNGGLGIERAVHEGAVPGHRQPKRRLVAALHKDPHRARRPLNLIIGG
jgi:hypothetical protein